VNSIKAGKVQVEQDKVGLVFGENIDGTESIVRRPSVKTFGAQHHVDNFANCGVIVDDENFCCHASPPGFVSE
jgi:hypothetical protein